MERPRIVCLCGSTRFWLEFQQALLDEALVGHIVLSPASNTGDDEDRSLSDTQLATLEELHLREVDLADEILVLNVDQYVDDTTGRAFLHAWAAGKGVRWLEPPGPELLARLNALVAALPQQAWEDAVRESRTCALCGSVQEGPIPKELTDGVD